MGSAVCISPAVGSAVVFALLDFCEVEALNYFANPLLEACFFPCVCVLGLI